MELNKELLQKIRDAKSADELISIARAEGQELTQENAEELFEKLHVEGELTDEMLDAVLGGFSPLKRTRKSLEFY